jgi:hypothetical protein
MAAIAVANYEYFGHIFTRVIRFILDASRKQFFVKR